MTFKVRAPLRHAYTMTARHNLPKLHVYTDQLFETESWIWMQKYIFLSSKCLHAT